MNFIKIESSWKELMSLEFEKSYFKSLADFVRGEYINKTIFPKPKDVFRAFDLCPVDKVKVVIIGQDPYHGTGQANGLCFAVENGTQLPPSLQNIFKEIKNDLSIEPLEEGDLSRWAKQGVLLLNSTLTVEKSRPTSHKDKGWEEFTDKVIENLSKRKENLVFILWGNYAKKKGLVIDREKHLIIQSAHPSPFSASNGFFDSKPFSKTNEYLRKNNLGEIDWR